VLFFVTLGDTHEPLGIILWAMGFGVLAGLVWLVFGIAVLVEAQRRRRFGSAHLRVGG
jgi:threonine/homoserine/homoserine lactone efflux protein